jgi:hypothetical protein
VTSAVETELKRIEEGVLHYEDANRLAATFWDRVNLILGYSTAITSGVTAAVAVPTDAGPLASAFAIVTAVLATTLAFFRPSERATAHRRAWLEFNCLRLDLRQAVLAGAPGFDGLGVLTERRNRVVAASPQYSQRTFEKARKRIQDGVYQYGADDA